MSVARIRPGERGADVASGSGDLARAFAARGARVCMSDINGPMLSRGPGPDAGRGDARRPRCSATPASAVRQREFRLRERGLRPAQHDAQGRRARGDDESPQAGRAPAGTRVLASVEAVAETLRPVFLSRCCRGSASGWRATPRPYRYLAESIRMHPDQPKLAAMLEQAGLERVEYFNLAAGAVAVHRGYKLR